MIHPKFDIATLRNISTIVGDALTHRQINEQLEGVGIEKLAGGNKADIIFNSLKHRQEQDKCGNNTIAFLLNFISPKRYGSEAEFEIYRNNINEKLSYEGLEFSKAGELRIVSKARTISEAKERSLKIKQKINGLNVHRDIIPYCEEQWLQENYFHAILEVTKSVAERLRSLSSYTQDGGELVDKCFGLGTDKKPMLAFNTLQSESDESEHKGFGNFCKGFFSIYRNPKAHNPKISENTQLEKMLEVMFVATIIHKNLDNTYKAGYK